MQTSRTDAPDLPWAGLTDPRLTTQFVLRLSDRELAQLRYIRAHSPESTQQFCRRHLLAAMAAEIERLTGVPA